MRLSPKIDPRLLTKKSVMLTHEKRNNRGLYEGVEVGQEVCGKVSTKVDPQTRAVTPHNVYHIQLYDEFALEIFRASPYFGRATFGMFLLCVLYHEMSHVVGERFVVIEPFNTFVLDYILNCLDDDRDEYIMGMDFPQSYKYLQLLLSSIRWSTPKGLGLDGLMTDLNTVFFMCRFGVIRSGSDADFVKFLLPRVISSRRGKRANSLKIGLAIYRYLKRKYQDKGQEEQMEQADSLPSPGQEPLSEQDKQDILSSPQAIQNANYDALKEDKDANIDIFQDGGQLAGLTGDPPESGELTDEFYNEVVKEFPDQIRDYRSLFLLKRQKLIKVPRLEGAINPKYLERIFVDSFTGEEHKNYLGLKKLELSVDAAYYYDVSGSTNGYKLQYAQNKVINLASLDGIRGIRTALVNFNTQGSLVKAFDEPLSQARFYPQAGGGTLLLPTLTGQSKVDIGVWKGQHKFAFFTTDGIIGDWLQCIPVLYTWHQDGIKIILIQIVQDPTITDIVAFRQNTLPDWMIGFASTVELLPARMMERMVI